MTGAPGEYAAPNDHWGSVEQLCRRMPRGALVVMDRRVARLHPRLPKALTACGPHDLVLVQGGERAKSFAALERVLRAGVGVPRTGALVSVGGGTVGDLSTVAAHLLKRGVKLIHMPTTLLAAVDSSQGGKGALDVHAGRHPVKNAAGVFHYPFECWLGEELFTSLSAAQLREGGIEAWKMVACLDAALWSRYRAAPPPLPQLVRDARRLKADVCEKDPYEQGGLRRVLNFGHTFGHVLESLSGLALAHGDAVGLGIYCALDVGRRVGVTSDPLAREVERGFEEGPGLLGRDGLAKALGRWAAPRLAELLGADKKATRAGELQMVLLAQLGAAVVQAVPAQAWRSLLEAWRSGARP